MPTRFPAALLACVTIMSACSSSTIPLADTSPPAPANPVGQNFAPRRPILPSKLPHGYRITEMRLDTRKFPGDMHTMYMPLASTISRGPLLLVAYWGDEQHQPFCGRPAAEITNQTVGNDGKLPDVAERTIVRWKGDFSAMLPDGGPNYTANGIYVMGRGVTDTQLRTAAARVDWEGEYPTIDAANLPPGFSLRATTRWSPWQSKALEFVHISGPKGNSVSIAADSGNEAARYFARFWVDVVERPCGRHVNRGPALVIDGATVRVRSYNEQVRDSTPASRRAARQIEQALIQVSRDRWDRTARPVTKALISKYFKRCWGEVGASGAHGAQPYDATFRGHEGSEDWIFAVDGDRSCANIAGGGTIRALNSHHTSVVTLIRGPIRIAPIRIDDEDGERLLLIGGQVDGSVDQVAVQLLGGSEIIAQLQPIPHGTAFAASLSVKRSALKRFFSSNYRNPYALTIVATDTAGQEVARWTSQFPV